MAKTINDLAQAAALATTDLFAVWQDGETRKTTAEALLALVGIGITDHGMLIGLGDDDHQIYALANGSRGAFLRSIHIAAGVITPATGALNLAGGATGYALIKNASGDITLQPTGLSGPPFNDDGSILKNFSDNTKSLRLNLGAITTATQRVWTVPDQNIDLTPGVTYQPADADLTALAALTDPATKLSGIEELADVTDATNVNAAGAVMHSDVAAAQGFLAKTASETYVAIKYNPDAAAGPTVNDDNTLGYSVGSRWLDTTNDKEFVCLDASTGTAVWIETTGAGAGGGAPTDAQYLALAANATLTGERIFTPGAGLIGTDAGANSTYTLALTAQSVADFLNGLTEISTLDQTNDMLMIRDATDSALKKIRWTGRLEVELDGNDYSVTPHTPSARNRIRFFTGAQDHIIEFPAGMSTTPPTYGIFVAPPANTLDIRRVTGSGVSIQGIAADGQLPGGVGIVPAGGWVFWATVDTNTIVFAPWSSTQAAQTVSGPVTFTDTVTFAGPVITASTSTTELLDVGIQLYNNRMYVTHAASVDFTVPNDAPAGSIWLIKPEHDGAIVSVEGDAGSVNGTAGGSARLVNGGRGYVFVRSNAGTAPVVEVFGDVIIAPAGIAAKTYDNEDHGLDFTVTSAGTQTFGAVAGFTAGFFVHIWNRTGGNVTIDGLDADGTLPNNGVCVVKKQADGSLTCNGSTGDVLLDAA